MENEKQLTAQTAARRIENGMLVGLGTGSTVNYFIEALAERCRQGLSITTVASSVISDIRARQAGLNPLPASHIGRLDVYVDGADEVTDDLVLLKGRGQDLVLEKLLAAHAGQFWVLADAGKRVAYLGQKFPIPLEVQPQAWRLVQKAISDLSGSTTLRPVAGGEGAAVSAHGSLILDAVFPAPFDSRRLDQLLNALPGVVEHGIFADLATLLFCGGGDGSVSEQTAVRINHKL